MMKPQQYAVRLERERQADQREGDHFAGYGLMGLAFQGGDVLAFRRFTASSMGPPFISLWHRDPQGRWVFHTNVDPQRACPRYFGAVLHDVVTDDIELSWTGMDELVLRLRRGRLQLGLRLAATPATTILSAACRLLPRRAWEVPTVNSAASAAAARLLRSGAMTLAGRAPSGHFFVVRPAALWRVAGAACVRNGRDLGAVTPLVERVALGDLVLPAEGLLAFGSTTFTARAGAGYPGVRMPPTPAEDGSHHGEGSVDTGLRHCAAVATATP
jgi:hypothetical protein